MRNTEKEEVSGTARNTLILEFKASTSCLEQDNPIMPQVTAVHTEKRGTTHFRINCLRTTRITQTAVRNNIKLRPKPN